MSKTLPQPIRIDLTSARRFALAHHHLWPPRQLKGKSGILQFIQHVGCIQFDPINLVGRNPDLVLQSRVIDYRPTMLDELLYQDRQLLDGWDKMASIYSLEDWAYFARQRQRMVAHHGAPDTVVSQVADQVLSAIDQSGPLSSLDFKGEATTKWFWGPTKAARAGLEGLYAMGVLGIHHRVNNRRYFERVEKLLPETLLALPDPNKDETAYQEWHILRRVRSLGLATPNAGEHWYGIIGVKSRQRQAILNRLAERGELVAIEVNGISGRTFYILTEDLPTLARIQNRPAPQAEAAFLGPLDNFLWNRKKNGWLFDFEYIWEVYKPKAQRKYGYYVLPVIYGDRFVARCDPAFDKKTRHLTLNNWWWETSIEPGQAMQSALETALGDFIRYLDAESFSLGETLVNKKSLAWTKAFE